MKKEEAQERTDRDGTWKDAISRFLNLPESEIVSLRSKGTENVSRFSWEDSAKRIIHLAEEISHG